MRYWRGKQGREVDFVMAHRRDEVDVIECKWNSNAFDAAAQAVFRSHYPKGRNYLVSPTGAPVGLTSDSVPSRYVCARRWNLLANQRRHLATEFR